MQNFNKLTKENKLNIFNQVSAKSGLPPYAIEKDWWVVQTLRIIFEMDISQHLVFKGGTSLSKAWGLIDRFSEDIDLILDKSILGFSEINTKKQVKTLRSVSKSYITNIFYPALNNAFDEAGLNSVSIQMDKTTENDPVQIGIYYPSVTPHAGYVKPRVLIEIGSRSLLDPFRIRAISSFIFDQFPDQGFADQPIQIPSVNPERTLLEKIFLLHEEFQKPKDKISAEHLSRHLYDIEKLMNTQYAELALKNKDLYQEIVVHRKLFFSMADVDYSLHQPQTINPIPPDEKLKDWENDYKELCENMIYGDKLSWDELLSRITALKKRINSILWKIDINN